MKLNRFLTVALGCLLVAVTAFGQTTGALSGTVTTSGSPLPGATVTVTSSSLQGSRTAVSDAVGSYTVTDLPPGTYTVRFELQGLAPFTKQVSVALAQTARVDADLQPRKPGDKEQFAEEVTVTGSLIPRPTLEAMSPVTTLDMAELAYQGTTRLEDMLTSLPQVFHAQNSTIANGASGTATIDLRYLGPVRTLVLIDGKRAPAGDVFAVSPDLNFIPAALVKRVDVLTGGASSTYGADAVAGVVNFVLDRDFEGLKAGIMGGGYEHNNNNALAQQMNKDAGFSYPHGQAWDGGNAEAYAALGGKFGDDKGHATVYLDYRKTAADLKNRRDYLNCALGGDDPAGPYCAGSSTIPAGRFRVYSPDYSTKLGDYVLDSTTGNTFRNRIGTDVFNYGPYNFMQRPDERWAGGAFLNYEWNKHAQAYADVMLMDDFSGAQIAPSGSFGSVLQQLNCDNPMLSAQEYQMICATHGYGPHDIASVIINRRSTEGGGRVDDLTHQSLRLVTGLKGEISKAWSYDVYGLNAQTRVPEIYRNDFSYNNIQDALLVDGNPNDPSTWHCRSGNSACVPWNIFKAGGVTKAALNFVQIPLLSSSQLKTRVLSGKLVGDLRDYGIAFPSASEGVSVAIGAEDRTEFLSYQPDQAYIDGIGAGQGGKRLPVAGSYRVNEGFTEFNIPIVQGARGVKDLSLDLAYRYSKYNINGGYNTWKAQGAWAPSADLKFRFGVNRATRAPNVVELFQPAAVVIGDTTNDPCAGATPTYSAAQCTHTGVSATQYGHVDANPALQYNGRFSGTATLTPEVADTKTLGVVFTPGSFGKGSFTAAFDYYDIKIDKVVTNLPGNNIVNKCAETGDPYLCSLIHRDIFGTLWMTSDAYVDQPNGNFGKREVKGVDANVTYTVPVGKTFLSLNLTGSRMMNWRLANQFFSYDCSGYYGNTCGDPNPKWRHLFRATWDTDRATVSLAWRYVGAVTVDEANTSPALYVPEDIATWKGVGGYHLSAFNYLDLAATLKISHAIQFMLGVNNIADKEPPLGAGFTGNDYAPGFHGTYDPYGRYIHSSVQFKF